MMGVVQRSPIDVTRHVEPGASWEMARGSAHPALTGSVRGYCGYLERTSEPVRRREVPNGGVTVILSLGDKLDVVTMSNSPQLGGTFRSFVAGFHEGYAITEHHGDQHGFEIDLSPLGAYRVFGIPMSEVANQVVELDALRAPDVTELTDRLADAPGWQQRFELVDQALLRWIGDGPSPDRSVAWAWTQLERTRGRVSIGALADEIGWSPRHLVERFRAHVGLAPKAAARVLRFGHAVELLGQGRGTIADVATTAGYADHSHLVRDCRSLAGCTPSQIVGDRNDDGGLAA